MKISGLFLATTISIILAISCGTDNLQPALPNIQFKLVLVDSIGVEKGDSNYIIGLPQVVSFTPNGGIAVLDQMKCTVTIFDSSGCYLCSIGEEGQGPGQFHRPSGLAIFPDGSMIVSDANSVNLFDSTYSIIRKIGTLHTERVRSALDNGDYFGTDFRIDSSPDGPMFISTYGRWNRDCELLIEYKIRSVPTSVLQNESGIIRETNIMSCCASYMGTSFFSEISREEYTIYGYDTEGNLFITINDPEYRKVRRTHSEITRIIEVEKSYWSSIVSSSVSDQFEYEPLPYRPAINSMFVDHEERLWVQLGYYSIPIFRVYDMDGNVLFHVMLDPKLDEYDYSSWRFEGSRYGFIAYNTKPREYVRIYLLELQQVE